MLKSTLIFVSYRRGDTAGIAGRIVDRLNEEFGSAAFQITWKIDFLDVSKISPSSDFKEEIMKQLENSWIVLIIIGPDWQASRLNDHDDVVRIEIHEAIGQGKRILPVLIDGATMPLRAQLPSPIKKLANYQAVEIRHASFDRDVAYLASSISRAHKGLGLMRIMSAMQGWRGYLLMALLLLIAGIVNGGF